MSVVAAIGDRTLVWPYGKGGHWEAAPGGRMAHVTFIHGIANKPPRDVLLRSWITALGDGDGPELGVLGELLVQRVHRCRSRL
jgi:hypothetical protein